MSDFPKQTGRRVYQVGELSALVQNLLDDTPPSVWLEGELSNFRNPSGHWYFALKDSEAQLRCAMFRNANRLVRPLPADGQQVLVRGRITLYRPRGDLQLIVEHMEPAGEGALRRAFEQLKRQLEAEGLFEPAARRPIPALPRRIAIISSPTGAALQDMRTALARRFPLVPVVLIPVPVQGDAAAPAIARALTRDVARSGADVVLLARGGGSLEDLWAFNEEAVARAIRACPVPVITGVGHETDVTIADLAADLRAATPTAAAEHAVPDQRRLAADISAMTRRLQRILARRLEEQSSRWLQLSRRLERQAPSRALQQGQQRLDELCLRARRATRQQLGRERQRAAQFGSRLQRQRPDRGLRLQRQRLDGLLARLRAPAQRPVAQQRQRLASLLARIDSVNPEAVLKRGYALVYDARRQLVRDVGSPADGERLELRLANGELPVRVTR